MRSRSLVHIIPMSGAAGCATFAAADQLRRRAARRAGGRASEARAGGGDWGPRRCRPAAAGRRSAPEPGDPRQRVDQANAARDSAEPRRLPPCRPGLSVRRLPSIRSMPPPDSDRHRPGRRASSLFRSGRRRHRAVDHWRHREWDGSGKTTSWSSRPGPTSSPIWSSTATGALIKGAAPTERPYGVGVLDYPRTSSLRCAVKTLWPMPLRRSRRTSISTIFASVTPSRATIRPGARSMLSTMEGKSISSFLAALPRVRCRHCSSLVPRAGRRTSSITGCAPIT